MQRITLLRVGPTETAAPDLPGARMTVTVPELPDKVQGIQELIEWLKNNPDFLAMLIAAFLALLGGISPPRKAA